MSRLGLGLGLGHDRTLGDGGGADYPVARRDLLQEDEFFVLLEDGTSKVVLSFGTIDSLLLEDGAFLFKEDDGKLVIQQN